MVQVEQPKDIVPLPGSQTMFTELVKQPYRLSMET
jgi:hypothetical protein